MSSPNIAAAESRSNLENEIQIEVPEAPAFSEEAIALDFAEANRGSLAYVAAWKSWMMYDGNVWAEDKILAAFSMVRAHCRHYANGVEKGGASLASRSTVAAVEALAKSDPRLAATVEQWDADPWFLNTPAGRIDLKTGVRFGQSPSSYMTKITAVAPGGECPLWLKALDRWTGGDRDLQAYLQRLTGYALTGSTREHALFFFYGTGGNGKSKFLDTLASILGSYATTAAAETFTASYGDRNSADVASLRGARLVTATETEQGKPWAEARIKALTGGDRVSARLLYQNPFEFTPQCKIIIAGNHKPALKNVDEAMRRRFHLVPFTVTIPAAERDMDLSEKLRAEWGGILQWAIDGCVMYQQIGLQPPAAVTAATAEYFEEEDSLSLWIAERCWTGEGHMEGSGRLFADWSEWAKAVGEEPGSNKRFSTMLQAKGFEKTKTETGQKFLRITLVPHMA